MENKYYTPDLEDFCIGYEYEESITALPPFKYEKHKIKAAWEIAEVGRYCNVRTKYLDKEDIEKEGWVFNQHGRGGLLFSSPKNPHVRIEGDEFIYEEGYSAEYTYSLLLRDSKKIEISRYIEFKNEVIYKGDCPSINELRKIMKYLNIPTNGK